MLVLLIVSFRWIVDEKWSSIAVLGYFSILDATCRKQSDLGRIIGLFVEVGPRAWVT